LDADIVTNPPYGKATEFVKKALEICAPGHKVAMFLKIQFLESEKRRFIFENTPPVRIYVCIRRFVCAPGGHFEGLGSAVLYTWMIWRIGEYDNPPQIFWIN
jgi:hypothetical protein